MSRVAIMGSQNSIAVFKALGVVDFPIASIEDGIEVIKKVQEDEISVLFVTEDWAQKLDRELEVLKEGILPAVTIIPGPTGSMNYAQKELSKIVERAVGSDILKS